uniref:Protein VPRBP n=1 Tax=Schistocephalus solidus TaxID=70667 RepID=A0A0V0J861_SCHSO
MFVLQHLYSQSPDDAIECVIYCSMLFTLPRDDDNWDVGVQKAILSFICTLVYRPIDDREHPDQPVLASSVLSVGAALPLQENLSSPSPEFPFAPAKSFSRPTTGCRAPGSVRKRRLDSILAPSYETPTKQIASGSQPLPTPLPASESPATGSPAPRQTSVRGLTVVEPLRHPLLHHQMRLWSVVRRQHGLMLLLQQLDVKQPISEADSVRTLACRGLVGLARSEEVRSMLAKLPLFTKGSLQLLMKEPILPDRLVEHAEFCRYATILIRLVLGSLSDGITATDMSLDRVRRAVIVAKTRIQWDQEELLELIWRHLQAKGLHDAAAALQREANLKLDHAVPLQLPFYDDIGATPPHPFSSNTAPQPLATENSAPAGTLGPSGDATPATPTLRVTKLRAAVGGTLSTPKLYRDRLERPGVPNLYMKQPTAPADSEMSLSKIVESFLLHQHAQCPYPVSVCPRFSLYHPHRCPEPQQDTSIDYTRRLFMREAFSGSMRMRCSRKYDRRFLHSRFQPISVVRELDEDVQTAVCFSRTDDGAFLGTTSGAVTWVNVEDGGLPVELFRAQTSPISRLEHSRDGQRLLVCADWGEPAMVVARLTPSTEGGGGGGGNGSPWRANTEDLMFSIGEARYGEFCRTGLQNKVVATYGKMAKLAVGALFGCALVCVLLFI